MAMTCFNLKHPKVLSSKPISSLFFETSENEAVEGTMQINEVFYTYKEVEQYKMAKWSEELYAQFEGLKETVNCDILSTYSTTVDEKSKIDLFCKDEIRFLLFLYYNKSVNF